MSATDGEQKADTNLEYRVAEVERDMRELRHTGEDAQITYSVRRLLERIELRLTEIADGLGAKADRRDVERVDKRLRELEVSSVRREGPVIQELREFEGRLEVLATEVDRIRRESATEEEVTTALTTQAEKLGRDRRQRFTKTERIAALVLGVGAVAAVPLTALIEKL